MTDQASSSGNGSSPQVPPKIITGLELMRLVRDPDNAALAATQWVKGQLILERPTIHQAMKVTGCDPFKFMRLCQMKPRAFAALKLGDANLGRRRRPRAPISCAAE